MKYAVDMGSGDMIYIPNFIYIGSGIQKLIMRSTQTAWKSHKPTFIFFFQNKERKLKMNII
jgi:protein associated with RNAse G/E